MLRKRFFTILGMALLAGAFQARGSNLVTDPGFESCTAGGEIPPGWTAAGSVSCSQFFPHTGAWNARFFATEGTLSQTISTIPGDVYDFSFWLLEFTNASFPGSFMASFDGNTVLSVTDPNPAKSGQLLEDFTLEATGTTTTIAFTSIPGGANSYVVDDVSVTDLGPAPEPASLTFIGSGLLALGLWRFRARASSAGRQ